MKCKHRDILKQGPCPKIITIQVNLKTFHALDYVGRADYLIALVNDKLDKIIRVSSTRSEV